LPDKRGRSCKEKLLPGHLRKSVACMTKRKGKQQIREALWGKILLFLKEKPPVRRDEGESKTLQASDFNSANPPEERKT